MLVISGLPIQAGRVDVGQPGAGESACVTVLSWTKACKRLGAVVLALLAVLPTTL